jgi:hypothetical protein
MGDLKRLEEVFPKFREFLVRSEAGGGMPYTWANYLHQSLLASHKNFLDVEE